MARPEFNEEQMLQIRAGFESGLTIEEVETYAKPEFDNQKMEELRLGIESNISLETVMKRKIERNRKES